MFWSQLVDDAAVFPPVGLPLERAVEQHREHLAADYADLVASLVVPDTKLADLRPLLDPVLDAGLAADRPLAITVLVTGGAGAIEPAVRWSEGDGLELRRVRVLLRDGGGLGDDLARNAQRVAAMVDHCGVDVPVHVEVPSSPETSEHAWSAALDEVAMAGLGLTVRADEDLRRCLDAALDRETPFVVVGGPVREVLAATASALHGDPSPDGWESARRWLSAVSIADVSEVHEELVDADLWRSP
ncbi:hypothetical protein D9V37_07835 [Nocardioides mangrovicus]|uniref:Uncharacterized protein n=1 Tax=Nocardioides mangrovicus TaxID=2478913 RepID=A0A3L8P598_9ACTN|nr:hypothetical protein [Nocardioides mangrovicus]RLV49799.1 hypothetical protein D9V37_07835 [Nocardioides mangrovicus]